MEKESEGVSTERLIKRDSAAANFEPTISASATTLRPVSNSHFATLFFFHPFFLPCYDLNNRNSQMGQSFCNIDLSLR
jgi:hypothetical protein